MSKANNLTDFLTDLADTIRTKKGASGLIDPQDFSSEIASIEEGAFAGYMLPNKAYYSSFFVDNAVEYRAISKAAIQLTIPEVYIFDCKNRGGIIEIIYNGTTAPSPVEFTPTIKEDMLSKGARLYNDTTPITFTSYEQAQFYLKGSTVGATRAGDRIIFLSADGTKAWVPTGYPSNGDLTDYVSAVSDSYTTITPPVLICKSNSSIDGMSFTDWQSMIPQTSQLSSFSINMINPIVNLTNPATIYSVSRTTGSFNYYTES